MCTACSFFVCPARRTTHQRRASPAFNATCFALHNQVCTEDLSRLDIYAESPSSSSCGDWFQRRPRLCQTPLSLGISLPDWAFCRDPLEVGCRWIFLPVKLGFGSSYQGPVHAEAQLHTHSSRLERTCSSSTTSPVQMASTFVSAPNTSKLGQTESIPASLLIQFDTASAPWSNEPIIRVL
ncbi:hypothetical protein FA13DRAFT_1317405 [Coprinellus micaceus]|uniref:Uncharacterized protein n=1 Tax=Coprinellus micaceus TaxID=71717 RepID=A0A4Y7SRQ3_COPMI|nr:hypothetical protein FA13DRAFT_1317405 [Coprinellus micaceus]